MFDLKRAEFCHKKDLPQQIFGCCWCQAGRQCVHSPSYSLFSLARELRHKTWWQNVILSSPLPKPIRNSLIHRLIFVLWFVPLWTCAECGTGNISMLISTVAIKPCRPESIKSLIYLALKLPLASLINYCKTNLKTNKSLMAVLEPLNRSSDRFTRTRVKAPLFLSWQSVEKRLQFKCSPRICSLFHCAPSPPCLM